jgi:RNA polymerase nonessential primary-like sigma factor
MIEEIDSLGDYLRSIGRIPLMTAAEEIECGRLVHRYIDLLKQKQRREAALNCSINPSEWAEWVGINLSDLQAIVQSGQQAKRRIYRANLRLVVTVAQKVPRNIRGGLELLDLIQEGNLGLEQAILKFDPSKGYKFSTYAYWWIRQAINRGISDTSRTIRLPSHIIERASKVRRAVPQMQQILG